MSKKVFWERSFSESVRIVRRLVDSIWVGHYRFYDAKGVRRSRTIYLGDATGVDEARAMELLREVIFEEQRQRVKAEDIRNTSSAIQIRRSLGTSKSSIGAIAELVAAADLILKGYQVFRAIDSTCDCDLICLKDGQYSRVEVKGATQIENGKVKADIGRNIGKFDVLAVVLADGSVQYRAHSEITNKIYPLVGHKATDPELTIEETAPDLDTIQ